MPSARLHAPFEHPDWMVESKIIDVLRLYVNGGSVRLESENAREALTECFPPAFCGRATLSPGILLACYAAAQKAADPGDQNGDSRQARVLRSGHLFQALRFMLQVIDNCLVIRFCFFP